MKCDIRHFCKCGVDILMLALIVPFRSDNVIVLVLMVFRYDVAFVEELKM